MSNRKSVGTEHSMCVQPTFIIGTFDEDGNVNFAPITWLSITWNTESLHAYYQYVRYKENKTKCNKHETIFR